MSFPFNVRAYGVLILNGHLLLSEESRGQLTFTKLPGGGLEFGEGLVETVVREFKEETGLDVRVLSHIYTTDFFQVSAFSPRHQVISVYYKVGLSNEVLENPVLKPLEQHIRFFWKDMDSLSESDFTFPIDKKIVPLLKNL